MNLFNYNLAEIKISYSTNVPAGDRPHISSSRYAFELFCEIFQDVEYCEYFYVMPCNRANRVLGFSMISKGGLAGTVVDVRQIFQILLKSNAASFIIAHNHPSGHLMPSHQDIELTKRIKLAADILGFTLLDHLIISKNAYYSFADEGRL